MYLLDTNVISEFRRARPHGAVSAWMRTVDPASLFVPSIVAAEITAGILKLALTDMGRAQQLQAWFDDIDRTANYIDPGSRVFKKWASLMLNVDLRHFIDGLIAATAIEHDLTIVTRNIRDFAAFGVSIFNPFDYRS